MKVLTTGATGFIGGRLVRRLLARGDIVHAILRPESDQSLLPAAVTSHVHDGSGSGLCAILADTRPDLVFHLAARFQDRHTPDEINALISANITFGAVLAEAMVTAGATRLVNTGTSWQHYRDNAYSPVCLYAATKQALEDVLRYYVDAAGLSVVTLKLFDTYGPGDRRNKLLSLLTRAARGKSHLSMSPGEQAIDLVHVDDVVDAFLLAGERLLSDGVAGMEDYAVSSGCPRTLRDVAALVGRCVGTPLNIEWGGRPYRVREVMVPWSTGKPVPGWSPRIGLEEGIKAILAEHD